MKKLLMGFLFLGLLLPAQNNKELKKLSAQFQQEYNAAKEQLTQDKALGKIVAPDVEAGLVKIGENGLPLFNVLLNTRAGKAVDADVLWNTTIGGTTYTITGNGVEVSVWDGGAIRSTHQEFVGRVTLMNGNGFMGHSTGVAGTIGATGINPNAKGMAPGITFKSYDFINNTTEISDAIGLNLSNHSYGQPTGWSFRSNAPYGNVDPGAGWYLYSDYDVSSTEANFNGIYSEIARNFDQIAYLQPNHIWVKAAGNSRGDGPTGTTNAKFKWDGTNWVAITGAYPANNCGNTNYDCLPYDSTAKNLIIVGAINQLTTPDGRYYSPLNVVPASYSSFGPRDDGAIKPDVVAVGTGLITPNADTNSSYYPSASGTSFSSPSVTGVLALLNQLYMQEEGSFMRADLAKALLTHTTNECGTTQGPDYKFGWGLVDALTAATAIVNNGNTSYLSNNVLDNNVTYEYTVIADGSVPLKATISWIDPAYTNINYSTLNNRASMLINDLDLKIVKISDNSETLPWKLDPNNPGLGATKGNNTVDNVEQVFINAPTANAQYKIVVTHKGILVNNLNLSAPSNYGLVITGIKPNNAGVEDISDLSLQTSIYPNPVKEKLHIKLPMELQMKSISIFDSSGKLIKYTDKLVENSLNVSDLIQGTYLLQLNTEKGKIMKNFLKK